MKVLIIQSPYGEYLQDSVFLGFKDLFGADVESFRESGYLYKNYEFNRNSLWGMGFTYTNILDPELSVIERNPIEKIKDNYYDLIIYSNVSREKTFLDEVLKITGGKNVIMVNVEDMHQNFDNINDKVVYFKRELYEKPSSNVYPIFYGIHDSKIYEGEINKTQNISKSIPSFDYCTNISSSKIIFDNELDYYNDYRISNYGITMKKGGWDSMRHYEILANKCIPLFQDIDKCPELCLVNLPKDLLSEINSRYPTINEREYVDYLNELYTFTKNNLTTRNVAEYILNVLQ